MLGAANLTDGVSYFTYLGNSPESVSQTAEGKEVTLPPEAAPGHQMRLSLTLKVAECSPDVPTIAPASSPQQFHGIIDINLINMLRRHRSGVCTEIKGAMKSLRPPCRTKGNHRVRFQTGSPTYVPLRPLVPPSWRIVNEASLIYRMRFPSLLVEYCFYSYPYEIVKSFVGVDLFIITLPSKPHYCYNGSISLQSQYLIRADFTALPSVNLISTPVDHRLSDYYPGIFTRPMLSRHTTSKRLIFYAHDVLCRPIGSLASRVGTPGTFDKWVLAQRGALNTYSKNSHMWALIGRIRLILIQVPGIACDEACSAIDHTHV
ncbi:hypothetical protein EV127DRAFT_492326 [Xylaria flabelliformis]|nr:hypothetical protein EV127DRAFT_492326 [Xylaria flabelliformis]